MTSSKLEFKVSEVAIALGSGSSESDVIADMWRENLSQNQIDLILFQAKLMLAEMQEDQSEVPESFVMESIL